MTTKHSSHVTRFSWDASTYDEICINCGATDQVPGGWGELANPCPKPVGNGGVTLDEYYNQRLLIEKKEEEPQEISKEDCVNRLKHMAAYISLSLSHVDIHGLKGTDAEREQFVTVEKNQLEALKAAIFYLTGEHFEAPKLT